MTHIPIQTYIPVRGEFPQRCQPGGCFAVLACLL
jgi:hypothetical protein